MLVVCSVIDCFYYFYSLSWDLLKFKVQLLMHFPCFSSFYCQLSWHLNLFQIKIPSNESKFLFNLTWDLYFLCFSLCCFCM
jgi:hypothetical protein